jgi:ABC-type Fe3+-hydroxamate transport system substrate-binding protein
MRKAYFFITNGRRSATFFILGNDSLIIVIDSLGNCIYPRTIHPLRAISLVPSWSEFLCLLGDGINLVGRTKYCTQPTGLVEDIAVIGGTKNPNIELIVGLKPDIVVANREENKSEDIQLLRASGLSVYVTTAITVEEACEEMRDLEYQLVHRKDTSDQILKEVNNFTINNSLYGFIYLIWDQPIMAAGPNTYISNLIEYAGGRNLMPQSPDRYPKIKFDDIINMAPDFLFLPDEPYEFNETHQNTFSSLLPRTSVRLIDGKLASWYNQRLIDGLSFFSKLKAV